MTVCGIFGAVQLRPDAVVNAEAILGCTRRLAHRGPDAEGVTHLPEFSFGHRRLSVIDPDPASNQPMSDTAGEVYLTYNGEIYNFAELREELRRRGREFRTASDTEVILHAYAEWGPRFVERLLGMFAFGLYDRRQHRFLLARDHLGVKPLYFREHAGVLLFASELKAILAYPGVQRTLNLAAVSSFLSYRHVLGHETYFKGIEQLPPAHVLEVHDGRTISRQYWDIQLERRPRHTSNADRQGLKSLIGDAVRRQMVSDVPVGAFLSGGIDSSIIVCEMARTGQSVTTFTASFEGDAYDESGYAALVARRFRTEHHHLRLSVGQCLEHMRHLIRMKDQPLGMHNEVAMYLLARELRQHATVVLCGEGADELFDGYARLVRTPFEFARSRFLAYIPSSRSGADTRQTPLEYFLARYSYFPWHEKAALYSKPMLEAVDGDAMCLTMFERRFVQAAHRSYHDQIALVLQTLHLSGLLQMLDATTMAVGVEARVPFVDHRLVQVAANLPEREKLRWRTPVDFLAALAQPVALYSEVRDVSKYVLRRLYQEDLPAPVLNRRKMGFPVPLTEWLAGQRRDFVRAYLLRPSARIGEVFDRWRLRDWFDAPRSQDDLNFGRKLWLILNLEFWLEEYF